jgi:hypothetical protein
MSESSIEAGKCLEPPAEPHNYVCCGADCCSCDDSTDCPACE